MRFILVVMVDLEPILSTPSGTLDYTLDGMPVQCRVLRQTCICQGSILHNLSKYMHVIGEGEGKQRPQWKPILTTGKHAESPGNNRDTRAERWQLKGRYVTLVPL